MIPSRGVWAFVCFVTGSVACAGSWPDEPGIPVALTHAENLTAADSFLAALTARRRTENLSAPLVTPAFQSGIRTIAEDLQVGKISAKAARVAIQSWGREAYRAPVDAWILDCSAPGQIELPSSLVKREAAVISYAAAHFHPVSLPKKQCAILVVAR